MVPPGDRIWQLISPDCRMIIGFIGAAFILIIILVSFCICCCCKGGSKPEPETGRPLSSASSQMSDWARVEENHFRQLNNRPGANVIKLFYGHNLRMFVVSWSVCSWKAFVSLVWCFWARLEPTWVRRLSGYPLLACIWSYRQTLD